MMIKVSKIFPTDGTGYWSNVVKDVPVVALVLRQIDEEFGELQVYFDTQVWDIERDGLIYTDPKFLHELRHFLVGSLGLTSDVHYSEQGMQEHNYVSLDVGASFIASWASQEFDVVA